MTPNHTWQGIIGLIVLGALGYVLFVHNATPQQTPEAIDPTPKQMTISGTYGCLPHKNTDGPQTMECAFGIQTDEGAWYAANFGQSANAAEQFRGNAHVVVEGFAVPIRALSTNQWDKYNIAGIFTVTKTISADTQQAPTQPAGKINIRAVCESALAFMTFTDGASAEAFVAECIEGKHPEIIEQFKAQMGVDGAVI
jgi:hypothetical protein